MSDEQSKKVAADIGSKFSSWDDVRAPQKERADKLRPEIFLETRKSDKPEWKSDIHLNKIYSLYETQQAFIWDNIYSNIEQMFDVEGMDEVSNEAAVKQKANLVNAFYNMKVQKRLDKAIEYLSSVGEFCLFVCWKTKYKQIRRKMSFSEKIKDGGILSLLRGTQNFGVFNQQIYNGAYVEAINPLNLVWDPKVTPEDGESWDSCGKIIKSWETYESIANNKLYSLSKTQLSEIKRMLEDAKNEEKDVSADKKLDDVIDGNRVEVLQYWGNYTLSDGTVLNNWRIVSVAREFLAVFQENNWIVNPIINMALLRDVESKRGIPELYSVYDLCKEQENKVNLQNDAQSLNLNPPAYAPEGFFKKDKIELEPGKQIVYKLGMEDPNALIKMTFPLINNEAIIQYYDSTASNVSGIFPNMQGQDEDKDATATEIKVKVQGQTTRLSKTLDTIKQNGIVPMVEKVADLEANMKSGDENIFINDKWTKVNMLITDDIRQGNYDYKYTDNSGIQKKLQMNQTLTNILTPVWNDPAVNINKREVIVEALENAGIENPDKFIKPLPDPTQPVAGLGANVNTMPPVPAGTEEFSEVMNG